MKQEKILGSFRRAYGQQQCQYSGKIMEETRPALIAKIKNMIPQLE